MLFLIHQKNVMYSPVSNDFDCAIQEAANRHHHNYIVKESNDPQTGGLSFHQQKPIECDKL